MISETYLGKPVIMKAKGDNKAFFRIIKLEGTSANGGSLNSLVLISTPHGSLVRTGIFHLFDLKTPEEKLQLLGYEKMFSDKHPRIEMYNGALTYEQMNAT